WRHVPPEPGGGLQVRGYVAPRLGPLVALARRVDQHAAPPRRRPATHLDGLQPVGQQRRPGLLERQGVLRHRTLSPSRFTRRLSHGPHGTYESHGAHGTAAPTSPWATPRAPTSRCECCTA